MADSVQKIMEDMVPELEDLQQKKILDKTEIQSLVARRQDFEYKLRRMAVSKLDFLRAIEYELNLVQLKERRRSKLGIEKKGVSDFASMKRISFLYERALRKFNHDVQLWKQYIEYCKSIHSHNAIGKIIPRAIQLNPKEISLWLLHASWELESNNNIDGARTILQRALRLNQGASKVWLHFFAVEVRFIAKMLERRRRMGLVSTPSEEVLDEAEASSAGPDFDLRFHGGSSKGVKGEDGQEGEEEQEDEEDVKDELTRKQEEALFTALIPRVLFRNAIKSKDLHEDLTFRLEFLKHIPSVYSAALSALEGDQAVVQEAEGGVEGEDGEQEGADATAAAAASGKLSLAPFAYNHNPDDALMNCFMQYNGKSRSQMAKEIRRIKQKQADKKKNGGGDNMSDEDDSDDEDDETEGPELSTRPYRVDFVPLMEEILESIVRDFPHEAQAIRFQAEFAYIKRRIEQETIEELVKEELEGEEAEEKEKEKRSPEMVAFSVYERALSPDTLSSMHSAALEYYKAHKQSIDASPRVVRDRLVHLPSALWASYLDFVTARLATDPENEEVRAHLDALYRRLTSGQEAEGVLNESLVRRYANFLVDTRQLHEALALLAGVLEQPNHAPLPASASKKSQKGSNKSSFDLGVTYPKSLKLWSRYLELYEKIHEAVQAGVIGEQQEEEEQANKKRKKDAASTSSSAPATSFSYVTTPFLLSLYDAALSAVSLSDRSPLYSSLLDFQTSLLDTLCDPNGAYMSAPPSIVGVSPIDRPLVAAYLSVHRTFRRILACIPALPDVGRFKVRYLEWMSECVMGEDLVYTKVQREALGKGRRSTGGGRASMQSPTRKKPTTPKKGDSSKKKKRGAKYVDSDDEESQVKDAADEVSDVWPSTGIPLITLPGESSLRQLTDYLMDTPPVSLELVREAIETEGRLNPNPPMQQPSTTGMSTVIPVASSSSAAASSPEYHLHVRRMKDLYERALLSFGSSSPDLWFSYLVWARQQNNHKLIKTNQIHYRAERELKPEHQAQWAALQATLVQ